MMRGMNELFGTRIFVLVTGMFLVSVIGMPGCASEHKGTKARGLPAGFDVRSVSMFNGHTGDRITWEQLQDVFDEADVVIIGEQHGHPIGLPVAAAMFDDSIKRNEKTALSLEFFERDQQIAIDDYLANITDEEQFKKVANRTDGNYPAGHREMVEAAKAAGRSVIAANAPRRYIHIANTEGFDRLNELRPEQRALIVLPKTIPESGRYHDKFFELMSGIHGSNDGGPSSADDAKKDADRMTEEEKAEAAKKEKELMERITKMFRSQNTWDATMADSVLRGVLEGYKPVVLVVGQFHSDFGGGIPNRLIEQDSDLFIWTISMQDAWSEELRDEDKDRADCVVYMGPADDN